MKSGWYIFDKSKVYIAVAFNTKKEAEEELRELLRPYPRGHEWRKRLQTQFVEAASNQKVGEPPYGWRSKPDKRNGTQQVVHEHEQQVLKLIKKLGSGGWSAEEVARSLNGRGFTPRHGGEWTKELVEELNG